MDTGPKSVFPFHVFIEGDKPYTGHFKEHRYFHQLILIGLAFTISAGFMNAIAILDLYHYALTHLSGLTSSIAIRYIQGRYSEMWTFFFDILAYGIGACFSGFIVAHNRHTLGRHYAVGFFFQGVVLFYCTHVLVKSTNNDDRFIVQFLICLACGIQNGITSTYTNNIMRTTHVTGMVNDTFMLIGYWLRTRNIKADAWRLKVFPSIWTAFLVGSGLGVYTYLRLGYWAFIFPAIYAWMWSAILILLRGTDNPKQKHQLVDPITPTTTPTTTPGQNTPNTNTQQGKPEDKEKTNTESDEDFV